MALLGVSPHVAHSMRRGVLSCLVGLSLLLVGSVPSFAQRNGSVARAAVGSVLGASVGILAGAFAGGSYTSRDCPPGDPDACLGAAFPGFIWGAGIGATIGAPLGAHLGNHRRGSLTRSLVASTLIFGASVIALNALVDDGRTQHKSTAFAIAIATPIVQTITSTYIETRARPDR